MDLIFLALIATLLQHSLSLKLKYAKGYLPSFIIPNPGLNLFTKG